MTSIWLVLLELYLAAASRPYRARVVAGNPIVPKSCADRNHCESVFPDCLINASLAGPIKKAAEDQVDILVFPEAYGPDDPYSCTKPDTLLPAPGTMLCPDGVAVTSWWAKVACLAKQHRVLVVLGVYDWGACTPGPDPFLHRPFQCFGNLTMFNKAVAFGIDGTLLAVHHKHHLAHSLLPKENISQKRDGLVYNPGPLGVYNDDVCAAWPVPDSTTFMSHFGVKFGMIICHEINFASPVRSMIKEGVRDVIFPTQWGGSYGGYFGGTQSGFAVAHQVNLLSANGMNGGSGIWPADPNKPPVQIISTETTPDDPTPQRFGTLDLESPAAAKLPPVMAPAPVHPLRSKTRLLEASHMPTTELSLPEVHCQLDLHDAGGKGLFLFGASAGINVVGMFEASCWILSCENLQQAPRMIPDFARIAFWPVTEEDLAACKGAAPLTFTGTPKLEITAPGSNFFLPVGQCQDTSVPTPRPRTEAAGVAHRLMLATQCPLSFGAIRSFSQVEFEDPQCPSGFCPSPTLCNDSSWEWKFGAWCEIVPRNLSDLEVAQLFV
ncbi:Vanin-like protein 1 [Durusdinium trenchii]|uniref:Vanin-like protein 1 n=2 Tax=Durusdinium trenchii TaxID=1381693 RepID=A0ABP0JWK2_9DINO